MLLVRSKQEKRVLHFSSNLNIAVKVIIKIYEIRNVTGCGNGFRWWNELTGNY